MELVYRCRRQEKVFAEKTKFWMAFYKIFPGQRLNKVNDVIGKNVFGKGRNFGYLLSNNF